MQRQSSVGELSNIQALRALAAIAVVIAHIGPQLPPAMQLWTQEGIRGVDLFFVLSGFIMVHITKARWEGPGNFLALRALRIYPLWWICLFYYSDILSTLLHRLSTGAQPDWHAIRSVFLIPSLDASGAVAPSHIIIGWTLSYELYFYGLFALAMCTGSKHLFIKIAVLFAAALSLAPLLPAGAWQKFLMNSIYLEFLIGVFIGELFVRNRVVVALGALVAIRLAIPYLPPAWYPYYSLRCVDFGISMGIAVCVALLAETWRLCAPRPVVWLGDGSYSIYLVHALTLEFFIQLFTPFRTSHPLLYASSVLLGTLAVCMLVYVCVERPIHQFTRYLMRRKSSADASRTAEIETMP